jgi:ribonuclease J
MRVMLETVRPKFLIPAHGESRHLHLHGRLAQETGMKRENVFIMKDGAQWYSDGEKAWTEESLAMDEVFVDGRLVGEIGEIVMRDRHRLSQDGFIVALIPMNGRKQLVGEPQLVSRGFLYMNDADELLDNGREVVKKHYRKGKEQIQKALENFIYQETNLRPVILPRFINVN